jgi:putative ABC transport system substrate-binding protein
MRWVGVLTPADGQWEPDTFRDALRHLGWTEGRDLLLDVRSAEGLDWLPRLASDLVRNGPDVIVAVNTPGARAASTTGRGFLSCWGWLPIR